MPGFDGALPCFRLRGDLQPGFDESDRAALMLDVLPRRKMRPVARGGDR